MLKVKIDPAINAALAAYITHPVFKHILSDYIFCGDYLLIPVKKFTSQSVIDELISQGLVENINYLDCEQCLSERVCKNQ